MDRVRIVLMASWSNRSLMTLILLLLGCFQRRYLGQAAQMPLGPAVLRSKECLDQIPGDRPAFGSPPEAEHVQMIILYSLSRGEMILDQRGAHASDLVGADAGADAAATDRYAALHLRCGDGARERRYEVRIVVVRVEASCAEINDLVPRSVQPGGQFLLHCEPAVIGGDANAHGATFPIGAIAGFRRRARPDVR